MKLFVVAAIVATSGVHGQPVDFKGSKFGDSTAQFQELQRGFVCVEGRDPCRLLAWSTPDGREDATMTYAGEPAKGFYATFDNDRLVSVEVRIRPESFGQVLLGMTGKFGKPKLQHSTLQNRMGAKYRQTTAIWSRKDGVIVASRYGGDVTSGVVQLMSPERATEALTQAEAAKRKAKSDL